MSKSVLTTQVEKPKGKGATKIHIENRVASHEFILTDEYEAGIILVGSEVKSIRSGNASIRDAYCYINDNVLYIKNMHIAELKNSLNPHDVYRDRVLLLRKKEINKIKIELRNQGMTLIPTLLYNKKGLVKVRIKLAKGKKLYDKREALKEKDIDKKLRKQDF